MKSDAARARIRRERQGRRIPGATYRWQFNRNFTFREAAEAVDYLRDLGITDCYASPLFQAGAHSTHGYDICDYGRLNSNLGSEQDFALFSSKLREFDLGLLLDIVPNHMGSDLSNGWWSDVLENGPDSAFASYFDIEWEPPHSDLRGQVLIPVLGDHYANVLEGGQLRIEFHRGAFVVGYYERKFPVAPRSYAVVLAQALALLAPGGAAPSDVAVRLREIIQRLKLGPLPMSGGEWTAIKQELLKWHEEQAGFREALEATLADFNGSPGRPGSFDALDALLRSQYFRLAYWRIGSEEINYRRFFDVTELVSMKVERPEVFDACHRLVFQLVREGKVTGLRVDHPDGLWDPKLYFRRLEEQCRNIRREEALASTEFGGRRAEFEQSLLTAAASRMMETSVSGPDDAPQNQPFYIVVEKILSDGERLPRDWPVDGTTGYDFLNHVNALFVDALQEEAFDVIYHEFTGCQLDFETIVHHSKRQVLEVSLASELHGLAHRLKRLAVASRDGRDLTLKQIEHALAEIAAAFPVYRTYLDDECFGVRTSPAAAASAPFRVPSGGDGKIPVNVAAAGEQDAETVARAARDRQQIERAVRKAKGRNAHLDQAPFDFLARVLLLDPFAEFNSNEEELRRQFVMKFQQLTGPVTAKGIEDTAFYRYHRLISLNEVGGNPGAFGISVERFHTHNLRQCDQWPHSLLATATHDTKRGEDARARLNVLSEMPAAWDRTIRRWSSWNAPLKAVADGRPAPDANDEYLLYQTLVGAWPAAGSDPMELSAFRERISAYMLKAIKEAKVNTSWTEPNRPYEQAVQDFVRELIEGADSSPFLKDFQTFQRRVAYFGRFNSLSQVLLKMTSPGVPDFYQGTELWDFNLVDPDNRRPVDYALRRRYLAELRVEIEKAGSDISSLVMRLLQESGSGQIKVFVIVRILEFRKQQAALFRSGAYIPIAAHGRASNHVCAFARLLGDQAAVTVVPRLFYGLMAGAEHLPIGSAVWRDTHLQLPGEVGGQRFRNVLTNESIAVEERGGVRCLPMGSVLSVAPVALIERMDQ